MSVNHSGRGSRKQEWLRHNRLCLPFSTSWVQAAVLGSPGGKGLRVTGPSLVILQLRLPCSVGRWQPIPLLVLILLLCCVLPS
jgi:hypothetical protein